MDLRRLTAVFLGVAGLCLGIAGYVAEQSWLGIIGGVLALGVGIAAAAATGSAADARRTAEEAQLAADTSRAEASKLRTELGESQGRLGSAQQTLADLMEQRPPAGSFDRKFDETGQIVPTPGTNPVDTKALTDTETTLFSEAYFRVALDARIASARRHLRPVAVALVEVVDGQGGAGAKEADAVKVTGAIRQTLRDADTACRMSDGCFALILEDTPENGAVWTVERVRRNLISRHGQHTMWAGVACYPAHAFSTDELLDQASLALEAAREWKQDRIEVATAE